MNRATAAAYYNEIDPFCCDWIRNLIKEGLIPDGEVDNRSIADVRPDDVRGFRQAHFFCGIAGWAYALRLAGWPDDRPVWTGSCPCQPLSCAGKRAGEKDERHLWPEFYRLISECRPATVFGEQVASKDGLEWLDGISLDLEELGYAVGSGDLPAAGVRSPHIRQRVFWMADASGVRQQRLPEIAREDGEGDGWPEVPQRWSSVEPEGSRAAGIRWDGSDEFVLDRLADSDLRPSEQPDGHDIERGRQGDAKQARMGSKLGGLEHPTLDGRQQGRAESDRRGVAGGCSDDRLGNPNSSQLAEHPEQPAREERQATPGAGGTRDGLVQPDGTGPQQGCEAAQADGYGRAAESAGFWSDHLLIPCRDGKVRRISSEPSIQPLAHGVPTKRDDPRMEYLLARLGELGFDPAASKRILREARRNRVGILKGAGNAIVAAVAAEFIRATKDRVDYDANL